MKQSELKGDSSTHNGSGSNNQKEHEGRQIDRTLRVIHKKMMDLFHIDFTYFSDIKIVDKSEILDWLTRQVENNFQEKPTAQGNIEWKRFYRFLLESQVKDHFKRLAFYDQESDSLCISEGLFEDGVQHAISVSVHELSEKMLSTFLTPLLKEQSNLFKKKSLRIEETKDLNQISQLFDDYLRLVYANIFKEGICEAISLYTLREMETGEAHIIYLEEELNKEHSKCIKLLFNLENIQRDIEETNREAASLDSMSYATHVVKAKRLVMKTLRNSHIIKGVSYYLGYPLAKAFLDKYELRKTKIALEKHPPLKAEHFADPFTYLTLLESKNYPTRPDAHNIHQKSNQN